MASLKNMVNLVLIKYTLWFFLFKVDDLCLTNPCIHGTCTSSPGLYTCSCQDGYKGQDCDEGIYKIIVLYWQEESFP